MINCFEGDNSFLSNFYASPITIDNREYPTVEHFFQASKAVLDEEHEFIRKSDTPFIAKRRGKSIGLRADWEEVKEDIMLRGLVEKFKIPELKEKLLATGEHELEEGNFWHDRTWGVCYCEKCNGVGENKLGKMLMAIREELRKL